MATKKDSADEASAPKKHIENRTSWRILSELEEAPKGNIVKNWNNE
jgi:hypothetical protein